MTSEQDNSNRLAPIFDQEKIEDGFAVAGIFIRQVGTFLDNRVQEHRRALENVEQELAKPSEQRDQQKLEQAQRTLKDTQKWEMGGNGRLLLTAFTMAAGSNVTGPTSLMLRAAAVNTLQGLGARQIKLIADSLGSETARAALHAVLAGAGAAAQGQSVTSAALGASASVVLNNLAAVAYGHEESSDLTLEQREACKNLVTTLIAGATQALGGDAAVANVAATVEIENNYLSKAQQAQKEQELAECNNPHTYEALRVKWSHTAGRQNTCFLAGMVAGVPAYLYEIGRDSAGLVGPALVNMASAMPGGYYLIGSFGVSELVAYHVALGIAKAAVNPSGVYHALEQLISSEGALRNIPQAVKQSYVDRIQKQQEAYQRAGIKGSFTAGVESTKLIADVLSWAVPAGTLATGATKGGVALGRGVAVNIAKRAAIRGAAAEVAANTSKVATGLRAGVTKQSATAANLARQGTKTAAAALDSSELLKIQNNLIASAKKPINGQGLSVAARAWEKHAGRQGSALRPLTGNPAQKNAVVEKYIKDIINNPNVIRKNLSRGGFQYRLPDGHGVRYNADGSFNTLLDPLR